MVMCCLQILGPTMHAFTQADGTGGPFDQGSKIPLGSGYQFITLSAKART